MKNNIPAKLGLMAKLWAVDDDYTGNSPDIYAISVTTLIKPVRELILIMQERKNPSPVPDFVAPTDEELLSRVKAKIGQNIHSGYEQALIHRGIENMAKVGLGDVYLNSMRVNPKIKSEPEEENWDVYTERRATKKYGKYRVSGQIDSIVFGELGDLKTTSNFVYHLPDTKDKHILQGSINRVLQGDLVESDHICITYVILDYRAFEASRDNYVNTPVFDKNYVLLTREATHDFIMSRLDAVTKYIDSPQSELPKCNDKDLWVRGTKYKYFSKPTNKVATKVFDTMTEASGFLMSKGGKGIIKTVKGRPKACNYCSVKEVCQQRVALINSGDLTP